MRNDLFDDAELPEEEVPVQSAVEKVHMKRRTVSVNEKGYRIGEDHPNSQLSNDQVDRIRDLHEDYGLTYTQLARMFSVTKSMIAGICQYRRRAQTPFGYKTLRVDDDE